MPNGNSPLWSADASTSRILRPDRWADWLLRGVDFALIALMFVAPMVMGGRHPLGELVVVALIILAAVAWLIRQCLLAKAVWIHSGGEYLILAGALILVAQLVPLPEPLWKILSPHSHQILPLWTASADPAARLGTWSQVSLTPQATRSALVLFLAYGLLFVTVLQRIARLQDVERLLRWVAAASIVMASVALLQYLSGTTRYVWIFDNPERVPCSAVTGSFFNKNHFAHFLALGIGPLVWWVQTSIRRSESHRPNGFAVGNERPESWGLGLQLIALGIVLFALMMSFSRGGIAVMALAMIVVVLVLLRARLLGRKSAMSLGAALLLVVASLMVHGYGQVAERLGTAASIEKLDEQRGRRAIWAADAAAVMDYLPLGTGVGSHRDVYPMYINEATSTEYTHAECGPLQVALESGLPGLLLLLTGIGLCGWWCIAGLKDSTSSRVVACLAAVTASLAVSVAHSLIDFVWYIPACMTMTLILIACACRLRHFAVESSREIAPRGVAVPRGIWLGLTATAVLAGVGMVAYDVGPALASSHLDRAFTLAELADQEWSAVRTEPHGKNDPNSDALTRTISRADEMVAELERAVAADPLDARTHLRLASAYLRRFEIGQLTAENAMGLLMIQDAVNRSHFPSRKALDAWTTAAIGPSRRFLDLAIFHVRRGAELCPLQGEGYVYLSQLCFLEGAAPKVKSAYIDQALRVRPFDGDVLFAAGQEAILAGDGPRAMAFWRQSFHRDRTCQSRLIEILPHIDFGPGLTGPTFIIDQFRPDLDAMRMLHAQYQALRNPDILAEFDRHFVQMTLPLAKQADGYDAARLWIELSGLYCELDDPGRRRAAAQQAVAVAPNNYDAQLSLGICLFKQNEFASAERQIIWCVQRKPDSRELKNLLEEVEKARIDQETEARAGLPGDGRR